VLLCVARTFLFEQAKAIERPTILCKGKNKKRVMSFDVYCLKICSLDILVRVTLQIRKEIKIIVGKDSNNGENFPIFF